MIRKLALGIATMAIALTSLTACASSHPTGYYDTICVDPSTQVRMPDYYCTAGVYYHPSWIYYVPYGYVAPGVHVHVTHYSVNSYHRPTSGTIHTGGVPTSGGTAKKYTTGNVNLHKSTTKSTKQGSTTKNGSTRKNRTSFGGSTRRGSVGGSRRH